MARKKRLLNVLCILLILAIAGGTVWDFSRQLQRSLTAETYRTLSEVSQDYNKAFLNRIDCSIHTMRMAAGILQDAPKRPKEEILHVLQNAVDEGGFTRVAICDTDGFSYSNTGAAVNVAHRDYFQKAMRGETNISEPLRSAVSGADTLVIAVPLTREDEISGALLATYPLATAGAQLLDFTYYSDGYGFVVSPDGAIILSSNHADMLCRETNLFSFFEKTELADLSMDELRAAIREGTSRSFSFLYQGERRLVSFMPTTINNWYTFSIASDKMILKQRASTNRIVTQLALKVVGIGLLLLAWSVFSSRRHTEELRQANQKYQSLLDNINGGMLVAAHAHRAEEILVSYVSSGFTQMTGYTLEDLQTLYQGRYLELLPEEDRADALKKQLSQTESGNIYRLPYRLRRKDGVLIWVMDNGYLVRDAAGLYNHSILTDITAMKRQEEELQLSENRFSIAIHASSGALFEVDLKNQLYTHFENADRMFGTTFEKILEDTRVFSTLPYGEFVMGVTSYFFHPEDTAIAIHAMGELSKNGQTSYEARLRRSDSSYLWARVDLSLVRDSAGVPWRLIGYLSDINEVKKRTELLESEVQTDSMTGLYNKVATAILSNQILEANPNGHHALLVLDIDNFKGINDTLGHAFGDVVLIEVSAKLKAVFRDADVAGRVGGDEFAILMKDVTDTSHVLKKAAELSGAFRQTYAGKNENYKVSCSIGIVMAEGNSDSFEALYRKADAALYQAKQRGKDQFVLYREQDAASYPIESARLNDDELSGSHVHHNIEEYIFELLYASHDFDISINRALAAIGQQYHVSRAYIFENDRQNRCTSELYEWCNAGIRPEIGKLQNLEISSNGDSIFDCFDTNGLLYCNDVRELPEGPRQFLEGQGVLSALQMEISNDEKLYGFIGFDSCNEYRVWTAEEMEKLSFLSKVLSVFLFKEKAKISLLENLHTRLEILDILPDYICVVNPETHTIVYSNRRMQTLIPGAQSGVFCFSTLRGGQCAPCETCLVERIRRGDTDNLEIVSEDKSLHLKVHALAINWTNQQKMVLLYGSEKSEETL